MADPSVAALVPRPRGWAPADGWSLPGPLEVVDEGAGAGDPAVTRLRSAWPAAGGPPTEVRLAVAAPGGALRLGVDESHRIAIDADGVRIEAPNEVAARRAVETVLQLARGGRLPHGVIEDAPAHPWRGLLVDVCRHWIGPERVMATIDAMAAVKLDVLHLHLSDDHAFRLECSRYPRLHELGSDGRWYSRDDVAAVVEHAAAAGIRVVPEIDVPGHTTSWLVGHPELAATPGPFELRRTAGIATVALHPTSPEVRKVIAGVLDELVEQFPDAYLHIGGDEVSPEAWPGIDAPSAQEELTDAVARMVLERGRTPIVWDDAWHPGLPDGVVTQVWRGHRRLRHIAAAGGPVLWSSPYYLDLGYDPRHLHQHPLADAVTAAAARERIAGDPRVGEWGDLLRHMDREWDATVAEDPPAEVAAAAVLGGEACHWTELTPEHLFDLRTWPQAAAVADVLWSGDATDADHLHDRLHAVGAFLSATTPVDPEGDRRSAWLRLAGGDEELAAAIDVVAGCCEPVKWYARHAHLPDERIDGPFDRFVDALAPTARDLVRIEEGVDPQALLPTWRYAARTILEAGVGEGSPLAEVQAVAERLLAICDGEVPERPPVLGEVVVAVSVPLRERGARP